jgi:hypothetical protein
MTGRRILTLAAVALLALPLTSAQAGVRFGLNIGIGIPLFRPCYPPPPRVVVAPAPVYIQPAPVYVQQAPPPVYVQRAPVYVQQPAAVYPAPR